MCQAILEMFLWKGVLQAPPIHQVSDGIKHIMYYQMVNKNPHPSIHQVSDGINHIMYYQMVNKNPPCT